MTVTDETMLDRFRFARRCEWCRKTFLGGLDPHHLFSRGCGRIDVAVNLASLCRKCHTDHHYGNEPTRADLLAVVAAREKVQQFQIEEEIWRIRRLPKGSVP